MNKFSLDTASVNMVHDEKHTWTSEQVTEQLGIIEELYGNVRVVIEEIRLMETHKEGWTMATPKLKRYAIQHEGKNKTWNGIKALLKIEKEELEILVKIAHEKERRGKKGARRREKSIGREITRKGQRN